MKVGRRASRGLSPDMETRHFEVYLSTLQREADESLAAFNHPLGGAAPAQAFAARGASLLQVSLSARDAAEGLEPLENALIAFMQARTLCARMMEVPAQRFAGYVIELSFEADYERARHRAREYSDADCARRAPAPEPTPAPAAPPPLPRCGGCGHPVSREGAVMCDGCSPWAPPRAAAAPPPPTAPPPPFAWGAPPPGLAAPARAAAAAAAAAPGARLRPLRLPADLVPAFLAAAAANTELPNGGRETCGLLLGRFQAGAGGGEEGAVTHLLLPSQAGDACNCELDATGELQVALATTGALRGVPAGLAVLGWVHTHPTQSAFLSAPDMHTHAGYQALLREAVAVVVAPRDPAAGGRVVSRVLRLTDAATREAVLATPQPLHWRPAPAAPALPWPEARARFVDGATVLQACREQGFHAHEAQDSITIYEDCEHVAGAAAAAAGVVVVDVRGAAREAEEAAARATGGRAEGSSGGASAASGAGGSAAAGATLAPAWHCPRCTLENGAGAAHCGACGLGKPVARLASPWG